MTIRDTTASSSDSADSLPELSDVPVLVNVAGEEEREAFSRRSNAIEGLAVMTFILVLLWPVAYHFGVLRGYDIVNVATNLLLVLGGGYLLLVAPFLHKDTPESWGLGNPKTLWRLFRSGTLPQRIGLSIVLAVVFAGLNYANYVHWDRVLDFFGVQGSVLEGFTKDYPGRLFIFLFGSAAASVILLFIIRYDNFLPAFGAALKIAAPLLCVILLAAWVQRGPEAFTRLRLGPWMLDVFGYVFWGFIQQLLFSAYFGTRFRKAFAPATPPAVPLSLFRRLLKSLLVGANIGLGSYILSLIGLSMVYSTFSIPAVIPACIGLAMFPFGVLYGYFLCRDAKRLLVATLTGACFGLIHIDSYFLVAVTFGLGIPLSYVFMEDRKRNLVALGFVHGLLGSTFGKLFSKGEAGLLEVDYGVGPWNIEHPTYAALVIPLLCIAGFLALIVWCARNIEESA